MPSQKVSIAIGSAVVLVGYCFYFVMPRVTVLNYSIFLFWYGILGSFIEDETFSNVTSNALLAAGLDILVFVIPTALIAVCLFAIPAGAVAWLCNRIGLGRYATYLIAGWLACYMWLYSVGPRVAYFYE